MIILYSAAFQGLLVLLVNGQDAVQSLDTHNKFLSSPSHVVGSIAPRAHPVVPYIHRYRSYHSLLIRQEPGDPGQSVWLSKLLVIPQVYLVSNLDIPLFNSPLCRLNKRRKEIHTIGATILLPLFGHEITLDRGGSDCNLSSVSGSSC